MDVGNYNSADVARLARARRTGIRAAQKLKYVMQRQKPVYVPGSNLLVQPKVVKAKKKTVKGPGIQSKSLKKVVVNLPQGNVIPGIKYPAMPMNFKIGDALMNAAMNARPANFAVVPETTGLPKKRMSLLVPPKKGWAKRPRKPTKPKTPKVKGGPRPARRPSAASIAKAHRLVARGQARLDARDSLYTKKRLAAETAMDKCMTGCDTVYNRKAAAIEDWYKKARLAKPRRQGKPMSEETKVMLAAIREAKKAGTYVAPTPEQRRAAANLKAKARRLAKKAPPAGVVVV